MGRFIFGRRLSKKWWIWVRRASLGSCWHRIRYRNRSIFRLMCGRRGRRRRGRRCCRRMWRSCRWVGRSWRRRGCWIGWIWRWMRRLIWWWCRLILKGGWWSFKIKRLNDHDSYNNSKLIRFKFRNETLSTPHNHYQSTRRTLPRPPHFYPFHCKIW